MSCSIFFQVKFDENKAKLSLPTTAIKSTVNGNPFVHSRFEPNKISIASTPYNSTNGSAPYNSYHRAN
jgi:hypothetical protein